MRVGLLVTTGAILAGLGFMQSARAIHADDGSSISIAANQDFGLSLRASIMAVGGKANEYVYLGSNPYGLPDDYQVSKLEWDISSLVMAGGVASMQIGERIRVNLGGWVGVNKGDGTMDDYDFMDPANPDWTDWSHSDVDIESAYSVDINASYQFVEVGNFKFHAVIGYKEDYWEWSDYTGEYIYSSPGGFRDTVGNFGGVNGIDYNQTFDIPYIGLKTTLDESIFHASAYLQYSPFVSADDEDHHILRDIYFNESFENGDYFAMGADISIDLTDAVFLTCSLDLQSIPEFTGDMTLRDGTTGETQSAPNAAGIENNIAALSASIGYKF